MDYNYPLLQKIFSTFKAIPHDVSTIHLICCQHLLEPQLKMFEYLIDFGFKPENIIVLGKIYSTNKEVFTELKTLGINVRSPEFSGSSFDEEHHKNCISLLKSLSTDIKNIIILDDGGELIKVFAEEKKSILFAVEQTSSGFRKLENMQFDFPIINVARSSIKLIQESPIVARISYERIQNYIEIAKIFNPSFLVVGLGPIGQSMMQILQDSKYSVQGFDIKNGHSDPIGTIEKIKPDIIIGATGSQILELKDIESLYSDHIFHLISISSSDREFPVSSLRKNNPIHDDVIYKNFIFVNNGFPITFKGNRYEVTSIEIELTIALLGGSIAYGSTHDLLEQEGFIDIPKELEDLINSPI